MYTAATAINLTQMKLLRVTLAHCSLYASYV